MKAMILISEVVFRIIFDIFEVHVFPDWRNKHNYVDITLWIDSVIYYWHSTKKSKKKRKLTYKSDSPRRGSFYYVRFLLDLLL